MPEKGKLCPLGRYAGNLAARYRFAGELLSLPREARRILRGIDSAAPSITDAFDRAARLYQVALVAGQAFPTLGLAYRVAAVEVISKTDPQSHGFSDFARKQVSSRPNLEAVLTYLYGPVRSAHFHAGEFVMGEFAASEAGLGFIDRDRVMLDDLHRTCHEVTREAIVKWLGELTPDVVDDAAPQP